MFVCTPPYSCMGHCVWLVICLACHAWWHSEDVHIGRMAVSTHNFVDKSFALPLLNKQVSVLHSATARPPGTNYSISFLATRGCWNVFLCPHPSQHHHCSKWLIMEGGLFKCILLIRAYESASLDKLKSSRKNLKNSVIYPSVDELCDYICRQRPVEIIWLCGSRWEIQQFVKTFHRWQSWYVRILVCYKKTVLPKVIRRNKDLELLISLSVIRIQKEFIVVCRCVKQVARPQIASYTKDVLALTQWPFVLGYGPKLWRTGSFCFRKEDLEV